MKDLGKLMIESRECVLYTLIQHYIQTDKMQRIPEKELALKGNATILDLINTQLNK